jgi:hypothetical protein
MTFARHKSRNNAPGATSIDDVYRCVDLQSMAVIVLGSCYNSTRHTPAIDAWALGFWSSTQQKCRLSVRGWTRSTAELASISVIIRGVERRAEFADTLVSVSRDNSLGHDQNRALIRDALQRLASHCFIARNVLSRQYAFVRPNENEREARSIDAMLSAVASGQSPCISPEGQLSLPGWAERRRTLRSAEHKRAILIWGTQSCLVTIVDRTQFGIGVQGHSGLPLHGTVTVALDGEEAQLARVAWIAGTRAGLTMAKGATLHPRSNSECAV